MTRLDLSGNSLGGVYSLPDLPDLEYLDISRYSLPDLEYLDISRYSLPDLEYLGLSR